MSHPTLDLARAESALAGADVRKQASGSRLGAVPAGDTAARCST